MYQIQSPFGPKVRSITDRLLVIVAVLLLFAQTGSAEPPPLGITSRATVDRVIDGDTVDVVIQLKVRVRLLDCWAPETRGESKPQGDRSKAAMERLLPVGSDVVLYVPTDDSSSLADLLTFGRVLGYLWQDGSKQHVSEIMVESGHATREKSR